MERNFSGNQRGTFELQELQKRYRIVKDGGAHAFVDKASAAYECPLSAQERKIYTQSEPFRF